MEKIRTYAKVNIGLNILKDNKHFNKHKIKSIFCLVDDYYDDIYIKKSKVDVINYFDSKNQHLLIKNDVVSKTIQFMKSYFNILDCFDIKIVKSIPMQAGLGGSSSDSGAIIKFLINKYQLKLSKKMFKKIAIELGSDICFFISNFKLALVSSFGNKIKEIKKDKPKFKIIHNQYRCDTKNIYNAFRKNPKKTKNNYKKIIKNLSNLSKLKIYNDLQPIAFKINNQLLKFYNKLEHKEHIILTGSGSYLIDFNNKENE